MIGERIVVVVVGLSAGFLTSVNQIVGIVHWHVHDLVNVGDHRVGLIHGGHLKRVGWRFVCQCVIDCRWISISNLLRMMMMLVVPCC